MRLLQLPVEATPRLELAHSRGDSVFTLHPITTLRPAVGTVDTVMNCGTCGVDVPLRLSSAEWVRARRRRQLLVGVTLVLVQVTIGTLLFVQDIRLDWGGLPALIGFFMVMLTVFTAGPPLRECREEDGVVSLDPGHTLREPGDRIDYADSDGGNYEAGL